MSATPWRATSAGSFCRDVVHRGMRQVSADAAGAAGVADEGAATVEAALALCAIVVVLVLVLSAVMAVFAQLRCADAAREAARLAARGEADRAGNVVRQLAPAGARLRVIVVGDEVSVEVTAEPAGGFLPGIHLHAQAYSVLEPDAPDAGAPPATSRAPTASDPNDGTNDGTKGGELGP